MPARNRRGLMAADAETDEGGPHGLLMWGQAGVYNAVDDRLAIAALCDSAVGVVRPARLTPATGLTVTVSPGWLAVASCDDGTTCVVGSRQTHALAVSAGPATGPARRDHVWVDTDPDGGRWDLRTVPEPDTIGRAGVSLGVITVPAGASLATQLTFSQWVPTLGRHSDMGTVDAAGTGMTRMTAAYPIAPYQCEPHNAFRVRAWGEGIAGSSLTSIIFRGNLDSSPVVRINPTGAIGARDRFDWEAEVQYQVNLEGTGMRSVVRVLLSRWQQNSPTAGETAAPRTISAVRTNWGGGPLLPQWTDICVQAGWGANAAGQRLTSQGSTYDTYQHYWAH